LRLRISRTENFSRLERRVHNIFSRPYFAEDIIRANPGWLIEFYEFGDAELYNLAADPSEQKNLAMENPEKLQELRNALADWQQTLNAKMPQPNPDWRP
jgi:hypothetical protein